MTSWKTTLGGILAVIPQIITALGPDVLPQVWANLITAVCAAIALYFAKDRNVTGVN